VTASRGRYLYLLAHLCHCPPPVVDEMRVTDFALLVDGISQHLAEMSRPG
jgi:hypothetical protein